MTVTERRVDIQLARWLAEEQLERTRWCNRFHEVIRRWYRRYGYRQSYASLTRRLQKKHGLDKNYNPL